ncbi:tetratricopeptide repeat protein [Arcticibacter tournemirensis]
MIKIILPTLLIVLAISTNAQTPGALDNEKLLDLMQTQRYQEAALFIKSVYHDDVSDVKALSRLAYCNYMAGNLAEAERNYTALYDKDTLNNTLLSNLANVQLKRGNYHQATYYLKKLVLRDTLNFTVYKQLGQIGEITGDSNTVGYLSRANHLNSYDADVAYDLANLYIQTKQFGKADTVLSNAIKADTTNLLLIRTKAKLAYSRDSWTELVQLCTKLIKAGDGSMIVINWLGEGYYYIKQYKKCIETFQSIEKLGLEKESSLYFTAKSYKNLNDHSNAVKYFRKTIQSSISPNVGNYYTEAGDSQEKLKQATGALNSYLKSLQFEENAFTYYMIANLYDQALKNKQKAAIYFRKFLKTAVSQNAKQRPYIVYAETRLREITK